jgi:hypothetical protein
MEYQKPSVETRSPQVLANLESIIDLLQQFNDSESAR